jgi:hypothetical protein
MKRLWLYTSVALFVVLSACNAYAQSPADATTAPDYSKAASWVCRPGSEDVCTTGLDAVVVYPDGHKVAQHFEPAKDPAIDCFYVYPTVSREPAPFADMTDSPEIQQVVKAQVGRLTSRCRVFAPIYRQATVFQLHQSFVGAGAMSFDQPLLDVQAAWSYYLKHDNHGRGVVLIGHSQGAILLQTLIARSIDGTPAQSLLVSAFFAGDPSLGVPPGEAVGGTFAHVPVCAAASQTGCVYAWGSYLVDDASKNHLFGKTRSDGLVSACASPAAPSGGAGMVKFYYEKDSTAPASDPPWVEAVEQVSGACHVDSEGNAFRVSVEPGRSAEYYNAMLKRSEYRPGWGLHLRDVGLVQGNILDVLDAEIAAWRKVH